MKQGDRPRTGGEGTTIFLTTQYLEEADQLADRIAVLDQGHIVATTARGLIADAVIADAVIPGVGLAMGFRSEAGLLDWLAAIGIVLLLGVGAGWLTVAMGLAATSVESAGVATVPLIMRPFLSSAFVPANTMGTGVRQCAECQPFTPIIETLRGLLSGHHASAGDTFTGLAWCVGFAVAGYLWAVSAFRKRA